MSLVKSPSHRNIKNESFNFQNLQPINYLKTFNKMLDYMSKPSVQLPQSSKELKTVKLSKFPLHSYYDQMQGILEGGSKKLNENQKHNKKDIQLQKLEQKFLDKHYTFVKSALQKIISDNQTHQQILVKSKKFYQSNHSKRNDPEYQSQIVKMVKLRSEPKLSSIKNTINSARKTIEQSSNYNSARTLKNSIVKSHAKHESQKSIDYNKRNTRKSTNEDKYKNINQDKNKTNKTQFSTITNNQYKLNKSLKKLNQQENISLLQDEEHNPIFRKLKPPQKIEKYRITKFQQIDHLLTARKTLLQNKQKNSNETIYPLTQRKHYKQKAEAIKNNQRKASLLAQKNNQNESKNQSIKFKQQKQLRNQFEDYQNEQNNKIDEQSLNQFKKQLSMSRKKRKLSNSQNGSFNEQIQDEDEKFFRQVEYLQNQQMKTQQQFGLIVQQKIKQVKLKIKEHIHQVKKFNYAPPQQSPKSTTNKKIKN